jgi:hypothetical protein
VTTSRFDIDPYLNDPTHWATSMAHHADLMIPCLDAVGAKSILEVGAYAGDLTRLLADWAAQAGARVMAIDPSPQPGLVQLAADRDQVELVRRTSFDALPEVEPADVVVIDGDHNYFTVTRELELIEARAAGRDLPLLLFHDVAWPHARRDDYFAPEDIPAEYRHPIAGEKGGLFPGDPGLRKDGVPYPKSAAHEGGPRNGVLTAVQDFVGSRDDLRLAVVPAFFGFGVLWPRSAPWADEVEEIVGPYDRHPLLERLEANRVHHLATVWESQTREGRQRGVLERLLESSAFAVAERLSRLRVKAGVAPAQSVISKDEIRRVLGR